MHPVSCLFTMLKNIRYKNTSKCRGTENILDLFEMQNKQKTDKLCTVWNDYVEHGQLFWPAPYIQL